jgi:hypothetical protein
MSLVDEKKHGCTLLPIGGKCNVLGCRARVRAQCHHGQWCKKHETEHLKMVEEESKPA